MSITLIGPAQIPSMGFGTFQLEQDTVADMVAAALSEGFRHIDTAQAYDNETQVGEGLRRADVRRDDVFLTTKILPEHFAPEAFKTAAEASLKRLGTDYVDLLLLHWPSKDVPIADTIGALNDLITAGKVRHGGVSNFTMDMVDQAQAALNTPLAANQIELHPLIDQTRMIAHLASKGVAVEAYCPLAQGKVMENAVLHEIGAAHDASPVQIALAWILTRPMSIALPRTSNPGRLAGNLRAAEIVLNVDEIARIDVLGTAKGRLVSPETLAPKWDSSCAGPAEIPRGQ